MAAIATSNPDDACWLSRRTMMRNEGEDDRWMSDVRRGGAGFSKPWDGQRIE